MPSCPSACHAWTAGRVREGITPWRDPHRPSARDHPRHFNRFEQDMPDYPVNGAHGGTSATAVNGTVASGATAGGAVPVQQSRGGTRHADGTPVRVLVVDDEPSRAEWLSSVLRYEGWSVRTAGDGADAVRTA